MNDYNQNHYRFARSMDDSSKWFPSKRRGWDIDWLVVFGIVIFIFLGSYFGA